MDSKLFEAWFHDKFVPHVKKFCEQNGIEFKILLLLDNAPAHPSTARLQSRGGEVTTMFLPPNTTSILQPMDQGILEALKRRYKKNILRHLILENESSSLSVPEVVKKITIKDAVYWCAQAWEEAGLDSLRKGWNKLFLPQVDSSVDIENVSSIEEASVTADIEDCFQQLGYGSG